MAMLQVTVPSSSHKSHVIVIPSCGFPYPTGLSTKYSATYPSELQDVLPRTKFEAYMERINALLQGYGPCLCCFHVSYLLGLCTCCLACLPLCLCVCEAEKKLKQYLFVLSHQSPYLRWSLRRKGLSSWIQIEIREDE